MGSCYPSDGRHLDVVEGLLALWLGLRASDGLGGKPVGTINAAVWAHWWLKLTAAKGGKNDKDSYS